MPQATAPNRRLILTESNYYSQEANAAYFSASQLKQFMKCPAVAMAEIRGEYIRPVTSALLIGSYVDANFSGTMEQFRQEHPEIFKRDGSLKSDFVRAEEMCRRAERDAFFMEYMRGDKQSILTGEICGVPFKAKPDVLLDGERIVDLKTVKDFAPQYKAGAGRVSFIEAWMYDLQLAIYQRLEGHKLPCYIAAITKESTPNIAIIQVPQHYMDAAMSILEGNIEYFDAIKRGKIEADNCGMCDYCKETKTLNRVQSIEEFEMEDFGIE